MAKIIRIKKGLDIPLEGKAVGATMTDNLSDRFAIIPDDFPGYTWKVLVKAGDNIQSGAPLMAAKEQPELALVSPVSGTIEEINRGERRKIMFVSVKREGTQDSLKTAIGKSPAEKLEALKKSGLFAFMRQRPFDIVPIDDNPRDIFVTAFDSAPLAPAIEADSADLEAGLSYLASLTSGKVYLSVPAGSAITSAVAEVYEFQGPHPAGNVGTQIEAIKPVNKGETVWTLDARTAARIGHFAKTGTFDASTVVALTGPDVKNPHFVKTTIGASLSTLLKGELKEKEGNLRVISGNVLTGIKADPATGWLRFPYRQITVIDEGDHADEFMGWASLSPRKFSVSRTYPSFLSRHFNFDARIRGGHRAMIMNNEYERVFPFDIYPEYLIKAIEAKDIDKMEKLGIYEVAPEDFALPEFVDTSKIELQKLVREGLDYLREETI